MGEYIIREDDLGGEQVAALLRLHLGDMHQWSPSQSVHAMPIERLRASDVTFYGAWARAGQDCARLAACGALRQIDPGHGEIKSMRADPAYFGKGAGRAILLHILGQARARGYSRLSLETGRPAPFEPARRLYASHGFTQCPPFGDYTDDGFSMCMTMEL